MKTVVFVTLFLGLTNGIQTVEVAVDEGVERVEYHLDGEVVQRFAGPPWLAAIDLGEELAPHHLAAVALDGEGGELGRAEQWINLAGRGADARLWVERDGDGVAVRGGLAWGSTTQVQARSLRVTFDGEPLPVDNPGRFDRLTFGLPPHDPASLHVLSAEIGLPDGTTVGADAAFGGRFGDELSTTLTAVPVAVDGRRRLRDADDAGQWLHVGGETHPVLAVDSGAADLFVVMDRSAGDSLAELGVLLARRVGQGAALREFEGEHGSHKQMVLRPPIIDSPLLEVGLDPGDRMFLVQPMARRSPTGFLLYGVSVPLTMDDGGSAWQLTFRRFPDRGWGRPQHLAEALATIAMTAANSGRPRAMVLLLGPEGRDDSAFSPEQVRRYLERLRVPLVVWYVDLEGDTAADGDGGEGAGGEAEPTRAERLAAARATWGPEVRDVPGLPTWLRVNRQLQERLERQRILWIEGIHPPSAVELRDAPAWLHPVASGPGA